MTTTSENAIEIDYLITRGTAKRLVYYALHRMQTVKYLMMILENNGTVGASLTWTNQILLH